MQRYQSICNQEIQLTLSKRFHKVVMIKRSLLLKIYEVRHNIALVYAQGEELRRQIVLTKSSSTLQVQIFDNQL